MLFSALERLTGTFPALCIQGPQFDSSFKQGTLKKVEYRLAFTCSALGAPHDSSLSKRPHSTADSTISNPVIGASVSKSASPLTR